MKTKSKTETEHPIATAVGRAAGTVAATLGLGGDELSEAKKKMERIPRKVKKTLKKKRVAASKAQPSQT